MKSIFAVLALLLAMTGCVIHAPVKAYHWAYCDKMNADGKHCDHWSTPCGSLRCKD